MYACTRVCADWILLPPTENIQCARYFFFFIIIIILLLVAKLAGSP